MPVYKCRIVAPKVGRWHSLQAESPEAAAQELLAQNSSYTHDVEPVLRYRPDPIRSAEVVAFARVDVESPDGVPHGEWIARLFLTGIGRRHGGAARAKMLRLPDIAQRLEWKHPVEDLMADGWEGEESTYQELKE